MRTKVAPDDEPKSRFQDPAVFPLELALAALKAGSNMNGLFAAPTEPLRLKSEWRQEIYETVNSSISQRRLMSKLQPHKFESKKTSGSSHIRFP